MTKDPDTIANWQRIGPDITTSGRLVACDIAQLGALGVQSVLNLALADSPGALDREAELLAAAGIAYRHIPVPFNAPDERHFADFCSALEASARPLHVHCIANYRVSAFFYRYHRDLCGMAEADARRLMTQQWQPDADGQAEMQVWAAFIERENS